MARAQEVYETDDARRSQDAVELENKLFAYPSHLRSFEIIDANLHWLTSQEHKKVEVADFSSGPKYKNALYIHKAEDLLGFFKDEDI